MALVATTGNRDGSRDSAGGRKEGRAVAAAWSYTDYFTFLEKHWVDLEASLFHEYGPWASCESDVTASGLLRALGLLKGFLAEGHTMAVIHGTRLGAAALLHFKRPAAGPMLSGGHSPKDVAALFANHVVMCFAVLRRMAREVAQRDRPAEADD